MSLVLEPIGIADFDAWVVGVRQRLATPRIAVRTWSPDSALASAAQLIAKLLPDGLATTGHRVYAVIDGGSVIGHVWMRVESGDAFIYDIHVTPAAGRHLGRSALSAASAVAAGLGASTAHLNVFRTDTALRDLVDAMDVEVSNSQMRRWLDRPAPTSADASLGVELRPMSAVELAAFRPVQEASYADGLVRSRLARSPDEARARAVAENEDSLAEGVNSVGQILLTAWAGDVAVGSLWLELSAEPDGAYAFVNDLVVHPEHRRRGYGRSIMLAVERECRDRGVVTLGLSVFGFNDGARALYEQVGYEVTEQLLWWDPRVSG